MRLIHTATAVKPGTRKVCVAIGFFDGVHLGHQQVIRQTLTDARQHEAIALTITFDRHPNTIVAPEKVPSLIYSLPQRLRAIEGLGVDTTLVLHFDQPFSQQSGETFIRSLNHDLGQIQSICVGANFVFGHKRSGNVNVLKKLGTELRFAVHGLAAVALDGKPVSSTRIRSAITDGDLDATSQMLGRAYSIAGNVLHGDKLGRKLGFPTANIDVSGLILPPNGVYAAHARFRKHTCRAVLNIGRRPTLENPNPPLRVEAHLLDFDGDLYGLEMEVIPLEKIRDEQKFPSLDALREQITRDIGQARTRFS